jgi:hypothetical protein
MKNNLLYVLLFSASLLIGQTPHKHIATSSNTSGHITTLDHPLLNGQPNAIIQVTQDYRTVYNAHTIGVWYNESRWTVYNQNRQTMPFDMQFHVLIETPSDNVFIHTATSSNTGGHITTLNHPQLNGNPNALILVTQNYGNSGPYNTNEVGVWYNGSSWTIYNENRQVMPANTKFNVSIQTGRATIHRADEIWGQVNSATRTIYNNPDNFIFITHNYNLSSVYNINPTGIFYAPNLPQTWSILTGNTAPMPKKAGFNVLAVPNQSANSAPVLISPTCGSVFNFYPRTTPLKWQPVDGEVSYTVEVDCFDCCTVGKWCTDTGKAWIIAPNLKTTNYTFDFAGQQPGRWRVWAVFSNGSQSAKSDWCTFEYRQ